MDEERLPYYCTEDVWRLMRTFPYLSLSTPDRGLRWLMRHTKLLETWGSYLPHHTTLRCEPLDFAYCHLQYIGALDENLLGDLLDDRWRSWREAVFAAWLVTLVPRPEFRELLVRARPRVPRNSWIIDLATCAIDGNSHPGLSRQIALAAQFREALGTVPKPHIQLRRNSVNCIREIERVRELVRRAYRTEGLEAAHATLASEAATSAMQLAPHTYPSRLIVAHDANHVQSVWHWGISIEPS